MNASKKERKIEWELNGRKGERERKCVWIVYGCDDFISALAFNERFIVLWLSLHDTRIDAKASLNVYAHFYIELKLTTVCCMPIFFLFLFLFRHRILLAHPRRYPMGLLWPVSFFVFFCCSCCLQNANFDAM